MFRYCLLLKIVPTILLAIEPHFVVLVCSYNNAKYCQRNVTSIFEQTYPHFRAIYIDDASKDGTLLKVKQLYNLYKPKCRFRFVENKTNRGCMENTYFAIHQCLDREIVVILDGDDWFAHKDVLLHLSKYYQNQNVWLTYGQYREYPSMKIGLCAECDTTADVRKLPWTTSHLKSFYAFLFKKIKKSDLMRKGKFISVTSDQAFMLPMLEMAKDRCRFISEVLYIYNKANVMGDHQKKAKEQLEMKQYIRSLPAYPKMSHCIQPAY
jgi:glycosyltransferase involved in cell wall biosynthesis